MLVGRFVGDVTTTSTLPLSVKDSARVFFRSRRVLPVATGGPWACAEVDAVAATTGRERRGQRQGRVSLASSPSPFPSPLPSLRPYHRRLPRPPSPASSSYSSSSPLDSYSCCRVRTGCQRILQGVHQLIRARIAARVFPLPDERRSCLRGRCFIGAESDFCVPGGRDGTRTRIMNCRAYLALAHNALRVMTVGNQKMT